MSSSGLLERRVCRIVKLGFWRSNVVFVLDVKQWTSRILEGVWEFIQPVLMGFVDLEKAVARESCGGVDRTMECRVPLCKLSTLCMTGVRAWSALVVRTHFH